MERRTVLKNMGLAAGYTLAAPSLIGLIQSCKGETAATWTPAFFSPEQGHVLKELVDIILPKTDTPSASEVNVHVILDKFANEVMEPVDQDFYKLTMDSFITKAKADAGKEDASELTAEDLEPVLSQTLKISEDDQNMKLEAIQSYNQSVADGSPSPLDEDSSRFAFANALRENTIWAYKNTEFVGEKVLAYDPIPGVPAIACGDLQELTGGKAWSL